MSTKTFQKLPHDDKSLSSLIDLISDWYWEQDSEFRFTHLEGRLLEGGGSLAGENLLGKRPWETGLIVVGEGGWEGHRTLLKTHKPFRDVVIYRNLPEDEINKFFSLTGEPFFDGAGGFAGYRGIGRDVTQGQKREKELMEFRAIMDVSPDMIYLVDRATMRFIYVNETAVAQSGLTREEVMNRTPYALLAVSREALEKMYDETIAAGSEGLVVRMKSAFISEGPQAGQRGYLELRRRAVRIDDHWIIVSISHDVSRQWIAEQSLQRLGIMYAALSATNEAIMRAKSPDELYQKVCDASVDAGKFTATAVLLPDPETATLIVAAASGVGAPELRQARISLYDEEFSEGRGIIGKAFHTGKPCLTKDYPADDRSENETEPAKKAGSAAAVSLLKGSQAIGVMLFRSGNKYTFDDETVKLLERMAENVVFALDNFEHEAERKHTEERIQYLATHDAMTDLPNRVMFSQLLNHTIQSARRFNRQFAIFFIDLDRFKVINDTLGHEAGDQMLQEIAKTLKRILREIDVVARLGGDEFVILIEEVNDLDQVTSVAQRILSGVMKPLVLMGHECRVTTSIGISMYPKDAQDEQSLMKNADIAMYLAKEEGKNNYQFYSKKMKAQSFERLSLETNLRWALERQELFLYYQPKLDLKTGAISGVEALLRWQNPVLGTVTPTRFIPVAEETGLIIPIGRWVLRTACAQNVAWQRQGLPEVCMAVNLSVRQLMDDNLLTDIQTTLKESGLKSHLLELEITESMLIQNPDRVIKILNEIKNLGVRLAIDDFGTGYSSLSQIKRFPIDTLKVDRSFIRDLAKNAEDKAITEAIIAMGKTLSLTVVAEGVETEEQDAFLREQACDEMQGYYFSKPTAPDQFAELLRSHIPAPAQQKS